MKANVFTTSITSVNECFYPCSHREAQICANTPYQTVTKIRRNCLYTCQGIWTYSITENSPMHHFQERKGTWSPHPAAPHPFQRTQSPMSRRLKVTHIKQACHRHVITKGRDVLGPPTSWARNLFIWRTHDCLPSPCVSWRTSDWNSIPDEECRSPESNVGSLLSYPQLSPDQPCQGSTYLKITKRYKQKIKPWCL